MNTPEVDMIVASVERVRARLYGVRLLERMTVALMVAGAVAVPLMLARWMHAQDPKWAIATALVPVVGAGYVMWARRREWFGGKKDGEGNEGGVNFGLVLAALAVLFGAGLIGMFVAGAAGRVAMWMIPAGAGVAMGMAALAWTRKVTRQAAAIFVDQQAGLKEKVSTALEFQKAGPASELEAAFRQPLITSAVAACHTVRKAKMGYGKLKPGMYAGAAACVAAAVAAMWLTPLHALANRAVGMDPLVGKQLDKLAVAMQEIEKQKPIKTESSVQAPLQRAMDSLRQPGEVSTMETIRALSEARNEMENELKKDEVAGKTESKLSGSENPVLHQAAEDANKLSQAIVSGAKGESGSKEARERAEEGIKAGAKAAGDKLAGGGMTPGEKADLKDKLDKAAAAASGDPKLQEALKAASNAVDKNDGKGLESNMEAAGQQMGQGKADGEMNNQELKKTIAAIEGTEKGLTQGEQSAQGDGTDGQGDNQAGNQNGNQGGSQGGGQQQANGGGGQQDQGQGGQDGQGTQGSQVAGQQQANGGGQQPGAGSNGAGASGGQQQIAQGSGSTEMKQAGGPGDHNQDGHIGGSTDHRNIYGEMEIATAGETRREALHLGKGASTGSVDDMQLKGRTPQQLQYEAQQAAAQREAMQQIDQQQIPPQYQELIKGFYKSGN